jgi:hypothetical protein
VKWPFQLSSLSISLHSPPDSLFIAHILANLPSTLTQLAIYVEGTKNYKAQKVLDSHFASLPPQLRVLRLPSCPNLSSNIVSSIPSSLTVFHLEGKEPAWFAAHRRGMPFLKDTPLQGDSKSSKSANSSASGKNQSKSKRKDKNEKRR